MADTAIKSSQVDLSQIENFDLHDPRTLKVFADKYVKPKSFLKDFFFPTSPADMFSTETVLLDNLTRGRKAAPFVISGSKTLGRDTFLTDEYRPPRIAPARVMTVDDLKKRGFGENLFNGDKPNVRASRMTIKDMQELSDMITRREEMICSEILRTNKCVMVHVDANGGADTETHTLKFYNGDVNPQQYAPATSWDNENADIISDIYQMRKQVRLTGNVGNVLLVSADVAELIMKNKVILEQLDNRRVEIGNINPRELPDGATLICSLNVMGATVDVVSYDASYEAEDGTDTAYLPNGTAILSAKGCGRGLYGGVVQLEHSSNDYQYYEGRRVPKIIKNVEGDEKKLQLVACPIMAPNTKGAWVSANVVFGD